MRALLFAIAAVLAAYALASDGQPPQQPVASCSTDTDCGCTDDCLD
jgi:hypothetical protein